MSGETWRVGRKVGRTIYRQVGDEPSDRDELIGVMDTPALAERACAGNGTADAIRREGQERCEQRIRDLQAEMQRHVDVLQRRAANADELRSIVVELARDGICEQWNEPGGKSCSELLPERQSPTEWCPTCRARALVQP